MKKTELLYRLTGTETPQFITEREDKIIDTCLKVINDREEELSSIKSIKVGVEFVFPDDLGDPTKAHLK